MDNTPWVSSQKASEGLGVSEETLKFWREVGYLKPGTHWRTDPHSRFLPWTPEVIYHLPWCKEEIDYWRDQDAPINKKVA